MKLENISKEYYLDGKKISILKNVSATFEKGCMYAIMGRSGAGKTTLVNIMGLLDKQTSGKYYIDGLDTTNLTEDEKADIISSKLGFVFQNFYLNENLTALENVMLPLYNNRTVKKEYRKKIAMSMLKKVNLEDRY